MRYYEQKLYRVYGLIFLRIENRKNIRRPFYSNPLQIQRFGIKIEQLFTTDINIVQILSATEYSKIAYFLKLRLEDILELSTS